MTERTEIPLPKDCQTLLSAWQGWRGDRLIPRHGDLDPASIPAILPRITLFEVRSSTEVTIRLAGTQYARELGHDPTGENYLASLSEPARTVRGRRLLALATHPCGSMVTFVRPRERGGPRITDALTLPLAPNDESEPEMLISVYQNRPEGVRAGDMLVPEFFTVVTRDFHLIDIGAGVPPDPGATVPDAPH